MYAIAFDLDTEMLNRHYPGNTPNNAYQDIERVFVRYGFFRQQGSVYFADAKQVDPVTCVLAVQELVKKHPWFRHVVADIRMLRIEENNDLMPAVGDYELPLSPAPTTAGT
ncbi:MAG: virulence factor [Gemmatimonas sp.]